MAAKTSKKMSLYEVYLRSAVLTMLLLAMSMTIPSSTMAGDSIYGKVTEVKSADVMTFDYGSGQYLVRVAGIRAIAEGPMQQKSRDFVAGMVLDKNVRLRFYGRNEKGEMVGRVQTDDPEKGIQDVGIELIRAGMARRIPKQDYRYRKLSEAEAEAQRAKRGVWADSEPG